MKTDNRVFSYGILLVAMSSLSILLPIKEVENFSSKKPFSVFGFKIKLPKIFNP